MSIHTVKLTRSLLKQFRKLEWRDVAKITNGKYDDLKVVGWIHGSVLGDEWKVYLLAETEPGSYGLVETIESTIRDKGYKQIYIA